MPLCEFIRGRVLLEPAGGGSPTPFVGATVRLYVGSGFTSRVVAVARTDAAGRFSVEVPSSPGATRSGVFRVFDGSLALSCHGDTRWSLTGTNPEHVLCAKASETCVAPTEQLPTIDPPEGESGSPLLWGQVRHVDGTPLVGATVELRTISTLLLDTGSPVAYATNAHGFYGFWHPPADFVLKARDSGGLLLASSAAQFNVTDFPLRIDMVTCDDRFRRPCEFARINAAITAVSTADPGTWGVETIAILSGRTGWDVERIGIWVLSRRIAALLPTEGPAQLVEQLYGLMREGFPRSRDGILVRTAASVTATLARAQRANIISDAAVQPINSPNALFAAARQAILASSRNDTIGAILATSGVLDSAMIGSFVDYYDTYTGTDADFWPGVASLSYFDETLAAEAKRLLTIGEIALMWAPAVTQILVVIGAGEPEAMAAIPHPDWITIAHATSPLPDGLVGETTSEQADDLARILEAHVALAYPSSTAMSALRTGSSTLGGVQAWLNDHPDFDFVRGRVEVTDPTATDDMKASVRRLQRLYRIAPASSRATAMTALFDAGVGSARQVAAMGATRFRARFGTPLGADGALEAFQKARSLAALATTFLAQAHPNLTMKGLRFLPEYAEDESGYVDVASAIPDLGTLFGSLSYCKCEECRSILGPSAYLADLLHWLGDRRLSDDSGSALDFLVGSADGTTILGRRPDLASLNLTCENATRALPYIDLALEILEAAAVNTTSDTDPDNDTAFSAYDTTAEGPELLAAPEHPNAAAYTLLGSATRAVGLPFLQPAAEMRAFLDFLGVDRADLMRAFQSGGTPSDADIGLENLRLSTEAWTAATATTSSNDGENAYWPETVAADVVALPVVTFRRAAEVEFADILDLVHARFVNPRFVPTSSGTETEVAYGDVNDIDSYQLQVPVADPPASHPNMDYTRLQPLRQLRRLWRATGWTVLQTDKVLHGLGAPTTLDDTTRTDLADIHRLCRLTRLDPVEIASWRSDVPLDVWDDRASQDHPVLSFYAEHILTPSLFDADARTTGWWAVVQDSASPAELLGATTDPVRTLGEEAATLQAVLGVDADQLSVLMAKTALADTSALSLANVSALYRWVSIARAANLAPDDATYLATMSGFDPTSSYAAAIDFLDEARELAAAGWTVDQLRYVVNHEATERVAPTDDWIQETLGKIRDAVSGAYGGLTAASTDAGMIDVVVKVLAEAFGLDRAVIDEWRTNAETTPWANLPWLSDLGATEEFTVAAATSVTLTPSTLRMHPGGTLTLPATTASVTGTPSTVDGIAYSGSAVGPFALTAPLSGAVLASETVAAVSGTPLTVDATLPAGATFSVNAGDTTCTLSSTLNVSYPSGSQDVVITTGGSTSMLVTLGTGGLSLTTGGHTYVFDAGATLTVTQTATPFTATLTSAASMDVATATFAVPATFPITDILIRFLCQSFWTTQADDPAVPWADLTRRDFGRDFTRIDLLAKLALVVRKLAVDADERAFWYTNASTWALAVVGGVSTDTSGIAYAELKAVIDLFALRRRLPGESPTFVDLLTSVQAGTEDTDDTGAGTGDWAFPGLLADRTAWDEDDLRALVTRFAAFATATPIAGLTSADGLTTLLDQVAIVRRVGGGASTVAGWAVGPNATYLTTTLSGEVVAAARSRYADAKQWATVAHPVRDRIRKLQRDALVSYLIPAVNDVRVAAGDEPIRDADGLYQYYYIDVSMNPEMLTSRIVKAYCTVQLFIHRCMFGLETSGGDVLVEFTDDDRRMWEWMRTYRVWQAARKVFLYPENWVLPELRDDKTPFYRTFEQDLAQGDLVAERVEQGVLDYLDRVHEVSNLVVLAYHVQNETVDDDVLDNVHVLARSRSVPATYWYRRREDSSTWTAWEKVDCGVTGDNVLLTVYNRRLLLFWVEFSTEQYQDDTGVEGATVTHSYLVARLFWSTYRDGKWQAKHTSEATLSTQGIGVGAAATAEEITDPLGIITIKVWSEGTPDTGSLKPSDYMITGTETADGFQVSLVVRQQWNGTLPTTPVGVFVLDACTMEVSANAGTGGDWKDRVGLIGAYWIAPGFQLPYSGTYRETGAHFWTDAKLDVYRADSATADTATAAESTPVTLLDNLGGGVMVTSGQWGDYVSQGPFFVNWNSRAYFVEPMSKVSATEGTRIGNGNVQEINPGNLTASTDYSELARLASTVSTDRLSGTETMLRDVDYALRTVAYAAPVNAYPGTYKFWNFYHPFLCSFIKEVRRDGVFSLLNPSSDEDASAFPLFRQQIGGEDIGNEDFATTFSPTDAVVTPYPVEDVDFSQEGAYSQYNWEIFFHGPFFVAQRLIENRQFDDAFDWFHTMFDPRTPAPVPTGYPDNARWWRIRPFLDPVSTPVTDWLGFTGADGDADAADAFEAQVSAWQEEPFKPHLLARLRPGTYQKVLVMAYLDGLIAWGDALFTKDTIESINEATMLYVFAKQLLGDRPEILEPTAEIPAMTFADLRGTLDDWSNATVVIENLYDAEVSGYGGADSGASSASGVGSMSYFCVPQNAKLLAYWDRVDDRLFKIRNGLNIEGVRRSLALFEPPIDPALLVRAAAAGLDLGSLLDADTVSRPNYRFNVLLGRAQAIAGSVKALGQALLSALEKQDAEALALLRQDHELDLLDHVKRSKEQALREAEANLAAAKQSKVMTTARQKYYQRLVDKGWIAEETKAASRARLASDAEIASGVVKGIQSVLGAIPDTSSGTTFLVEVGGGLLYRVLSGVAAGFDISAAAARGDAAHLSTAAAYKRRAQDWNFQITQATNELAQIAQQIAAAEIRVEIARQDLTNHDLQREQSAQVKDWMTSKFTSRDLYRWNVAQLATLYFQTYQLAVLMANKAQKAYQIEIGGDATFIQLTYWDSQRKGLLAGERLAADLERMDAAYLDNDVREYELTKPISLLLLDPVALQALRDNGECYFNVPEAYFDLDCPDHDFRRISGLAVSLSCVGNALGTVNAQLTLLGASIRQVGGSIVEPDGFSDTPSIVTSVAINDSGLFQADLRDPRYLPFERRGAVSRWHLKLTAMVEQFDPATLEDVTIHMRYTARDSGVAARTVSLADIGVGVATDGATPSFGGSVRIVSLLRDAPDDFAAAQTSDPPSDYISVSVTAAMLAPPHGTLAKILAIPVVAAGGTPPTALTPDSGAVTGPTAFGETKVYSFTDAALASDTVGITLSGADFSDLTDLVLAFLYT